MLKRVREQVRAVKQMRRALKPALLLMSFLLVALPAAAVNAKSLSIAVIDPVAALSNTDQAKAMMEQFKKEMGSDAQEALRLEDEIKELIEKAQKDAAIMSAEQAESLNAKAEDKKMEYGYVRKKLQKKQKEGRDQMLKVLGPKLEIAIGALIKEGKYDLILHRQAVLHSISSIDITNEITKKIDAMK